MFFTQDTGSFCLALPDHMCLLKTKNLGEKPTPPTADKEKTPFSTCKQHSSAKNDVSAPYSSSLHNEAFSSLGEGRFLVAATQRYGAGQHSRPRPGRMVGFLPSVTELR